MRGPSVEITEGLPLKPKLTLSRLKVPCRYFSPEKEGVELFRVADFKLGVGPCGKEVTALRTKWSTFSLIVTQVHTDKTVKRFIYPRTQITGRIEEEYSVGI